MGILVKIPGMFTTVQDEGRTGYQQFGVPVSGPLDSRAFHLANLLVGNPGGEGALEMSFQGPELLFEEDNVIAVTGADMRPELNGGPLSMYRAVSVKKGDTLSFGCAVNGSRGYLAFSGGLEIAPVFGSKSTLVSTGIGGYKGRKLYAGDRLGFASPKTSLPGMEGRHLPQPVYPADEIVLRVVLGPQDDAFSRDELRKFFFYGFTVTNGFDRMGCRLYRDEPVRHLTDGNIISDGIANGSIQVPPNGQPIIMLADRQTVGGYAKIGAVITVDLPKVAQAVPGMRVRFMEVSLELAQDLYIREVKELETADRLLNQR